MNAFTADESAVLAQIIKQRRDVRGNRFSDQIIEQATLDTLLEAALSAPSVGFSQPWQFVTIRNTTTKNAIKQSFDKASNHAKKSFTADKQTEYERLKLEGIIEAPINIAVFYNPSDAPVLGQNSMPKTGEYSVVCAIQNMWLMARALNIGLGWISIIDPEEVKTILNAPKKSELVAYLCLGYVDYFNSQPELEQRQWAKRKDKSEVLFDEHF